VITLDPSWLARGHGGANLPALLATARRWRAVGYDMAVNFEPDVRSNLIAAMAGARWTAGYRSGGGGALLDLALEYRPAEHTTDNARRLVAAVVDVPSRPSRLALELPESSRREAAALISSARRPLVAVHVSGGRPIKQWAPERFLTVSRTLVDDRGATIVLTGGPGDETLIEGMRTGLPADRVIDASKASGLLAVGAILAQCDLMITGDTGPMHLAAAVGTPIVAVFGPSEPRRYAPRGVHDRVIRVDLPCAPCNRIRLPPARCTGKTPDCLALVTPDRVIDAALAILDECRKAERNVPS
jgi:ADP-heptose:LPS heptosyltransferase